MRKSEASQLHETMLPPNPLTIEIRLSSTEARVVCSCQAPRHRTRQGLERLCGVRGENAWQSSFYQRWSFLLRVNINLSLCGTSGSFNSRPFKAPQAPQRALGAETPAPHGMVGGHSSVLGEHWGQTVSQAEPTPFLTPQPSQTPHPRLWVEEVGTGGGGWEVCGWREDAYC